MRSRAACREEGVGREDMVRVEEVILVVLLRLCASLFIQCEALLVDPSSSSFSSVNGFLLPFSTSSRMLVLLYHSIPTPTNPSRNLHVKQGQGSRS
jgi:hypothetical protein